MRRCDFSGLEINGEFVLGGSLNRKIGRFMPGSETAGARSGTVVGDRQGQQFAAIRTLRPCRLWRHLRDAVARFNRLSAGTSHIGFPAAARLSLPCQQTATLALAVGG